MIAKNVSLQPYNSFGIDVQAARFVAFDSQEFLQEILQTEIRKNQPLLVLGGGSNVLFTRDFEGLLLKNNIPGIELVQEDEEYFFVKVGAGVVWHQFVEYCLTNNMAGAENLALIPGSVGASPMQNIGAYGVELKDIFHELEAWHIRDVEPVTFAHGDCAFGYRDSVFKNKYRNEFIITSVQFRLRKNPVFHIEYGAIRQKLEEMQVQELSIRAIADAVMQIRRSKLPDPKQIGNAGSFFKNPELEPEQFETLHKRYSDVSGYTLDSGKIKIAAGWLIEKAGWKGFREGDAGCHQKQALVLVNYGQATGKQIFELSQKIQQDVYEKFGVQLEREVNII